MRIEGKDLMEQVEHVLFIVLTCKVIWVERDPLHC